MPETEDNTAEQPAIPGLYAPSEVPPDGNNADIDEDVKSALEGLLQKFQGQDKYSRRAEVIEARRQRFYDRGDQYIYWNASSFLFVPIIGGASLQIGSDSIDMPRYTDVYNIYHAYMRALQSVWSQNPPGVNFEPIDPAKSDDITAAKDAEDYRHVIDSVNERKRIQQEIARFFCTDGRAVVYTRTVVDGQRFGMDDGGNPKAGELSWVGGVLESKLPLTCNHISEFPYAIISDEMHISMAKAEYPDFASEIQPNAGAASGESAYERMARLGVLQGTRLLMQAGDAYAHLVTRHRAWFRPAAYLEAPKEIQDKLRTLFPNGVRINFVGNTYCGCWGESMDDHLAVGHCEAGDGQFRPSWGKPLVPIQDAYNDYKNMRKEYHDYGIPVTFFDQEIGDTDAIRDQISEPGNNIPVERANQTQPLGDCFYETTAAEPPADLVQAEQDLRDQLAQFVTAAFPALFGGNTGSNDTASGIATQRDQSMGIQGIPWGNMQELYAKIYEQAVMAAAKRADDTDEVSVSIPGRIATIRTIQLANLRKGHFRCRPDTDSSFPASQSQRKAAMAQFMQAAEFNPALAEAAMEPDNLELLKEVGGLPDLVIPAALARNKQRREIEQLLKQKPIPPAPQEVAGAIDNWAKGSAAAQITGAPEPPEPSIDDMMKPTVDVDPIFDFHKYEFDEVQAWLNSEDRWEQEKLGNQAGIENVRLHGIEHQKLMGMNAAPPPPMPVQKQNPVVAAANAKAAAAPAAPAPIM